MRLESSTAPHVAAALRRQSVRARFSTSSQAHPCARVGVLRVLPERVLSVNLGWPKARNRTPERLPHRKGLQ